MLILGIESTCDETGVAIAKLSGGGVEIISETKATSAEITSKYGGIVPEVVAREQVAVMIPVLSETLKKAGMTLEDVDGISVSFGPGLLGSLLIGVETAKTLAWALNKKLFKVNHMVAHVLANWILPTPNASEGQIEWKAPELPVVALVVSGGHTEIIYLENFKKWKKLGGTRDDAAGEAFDKAARALGLPYPGGPQIQTLSQETNGESEIKLPRPMIHEDNLEMSFSGLKTAVVDVMEKHQEELKKDPVKLALLAKEFNRAVVEVLVSKTMKAIDLYQPKSVLLAGGVAANTLLRENLKQETEKKGLKMFMPEFKYCTDNAAMIASAALLRPEEADPLKLRPDPVLEIVE